MPQQHDDQTRWFTAEVKPHEPLLRAWRRSQFPSECDLDDIVQDADVRLLRAHAEEEVVSPKAFLFAAARNLVRDRLRHRQVARAES